jgi:hypothetical protein
MSLLALRKQLRFRPKAINYLLLVTQEMYIQTCALKRLVLSTSSIEVISSLSLQELVYSFRSHPHAFPWRTTGQFKRSRNSFQDVCALHGYGRAQNIYLWVYSALLWAADRLSALVASVPGYRSRDPGFDSRRYQIFWEINNRSGSEWLGLVRIIEEILE